MASSLAMMSFAPTVVVRRRSSSSVSCGATAAKSSSGGSSSKEEKSLLDFIVGAIMKEDQVLLETDPILQKVEDKNVGSNGSTSGSRKNNTVAVPPKKSGGFGPFGGLFAKK